MKFFVLTIFPEIILPYFNWSILRRAQDKKLIKIETINPRDFTFDKHKTVDARPYGGGPGMVMKAEPIIRALDSLKSKIKSKRTKIILLSPRGKEFNQKKAAVLAEKFEAIILICGRYEGIDERLKKILKDNFNSSNLSPEELSIGSYILSGGELPSAVMIEAISRQIPGVLGKEESLEEKRFGKNLSISAPAYTRPKLIEYKGGKYQVPKVLFTGNHEKILRWRRKNAKKINN